MKVEQYNSSSSRSSSNLNVIVVLVMVDDNNCNYNNQDVPLYWFDPLFKMADSEPPPPPSSKYALNPLLNWQQERKKKLKV